MTDLWEAKDAAEHTNEWRVDTSEVRSIPRAHGGNSLEGFSVGRTFVFGRTFCLWREWMEVQMGKGRPVWSLL